MVLELYCTDRRGGNIEEENIKLNEAMKETTPQKQSQTTKTMQTGHTQILSTQDTTQVRSSFRRSVRVRFISFLYFFFFILSFFWRFTLIASMRGTDEVPSW